MREMSVVNKTVLQFIRYVFAGGIAFVVDFGTLVTCRELLFRDSAYGVYVSVVIAFLSGHIANYVLSLWLVFRDAEERRRRFTVRAFLLFALCALGGMVVTELGMWVGYGMAHFHYVAVKIVMAAIVFTLNFIGRKIIVSR
jgi:putative flippase GtrA